jgi:putative ABC transport system substrate-binding protein
MSRPSGLEAGMKRRQFLGLVGSGALAGPFAAQAQTAIPVIGYVSGRAADSEAPLREPFLKSLEEAGFVAGRNFTIEYRHAQGRDDRLPELAAELVRRQVAVLVATDNNSAVAAKAATSTIPIVFGTGDDPVRLGLVASSTGRQQHHRRLCVYVAIGGEAPEPDPRAVAQARFDRIRRQSKQLIHRDPGRGDAAAARTIGQPLVVLRVANEAEAEAAFATMAKQKVSAVQYGATILFQVINHRLVELAARYRIPASYEWRERSQPEG